MGDLLDMYEYMRGLEITKGLIYTLDHTNFECRIRTEVELTDEEKATIADYLKALRRNYTVIFE